jgi:ATP-dependent Clp protease ATP-binding subunit ClpC
VTLCEVNADMLEKFTDGALQVVSLAHEEAEWLNHRRVGTEHILLGILRQDKSAAARALDFLEITLNVTRDQVKRIMGEGEQSPTGQLPFSTRARTVFELSRLESSQLGCNYVGPEHVLLGIIRVPSCLALQVLAELDAKPDEVREQVKRQLLDQQNQEIVPAAAQAESARVPLSQICRDLTRQARAGALYPAVGQENAINRIIDVLGRPGRSIPVLVGSSSSALTAVVEGLAQRIVTGQVPDYLSEKRVYVFDSGGPGALADVIKQIHGRHDVILYIDRLHVLIKEEEEAASSSLKSALADEELQLIGAATPGEYRKHVQADEDMKEQIQAIMISEPTIMHSTAVLKEALRAATRTRIPRTY